MKPFIDGEAIGLPDSGGRWSDGEEGGSTASLESVCKKRRRKGAIRACRLCGKDSYPNYFYCPGCHHRISGGA